MINLLEKAPNIHSLAFHFENYLTKRSRTNRNAYWTNSRFVHRLKLRHLRVKITDINHVELVLDRFRNLFSVTFSFNGSLIDADEIVRYAKKLMPDCSVVYDCDNVWIWMDQRVETTDGRQRLEPSHSREDA